MKRGKKTIYLRVSLGFLALWLIFISVFTLYQVSRTREQQLNYISTLVQTGVSNTNGTFLEYMDEHTGNTVIPVAPINDIKAQVTSNLNRLTWGQDMEIACYDQNGALLAYSGPYLMISYEMPALSEHYQFGERHYGLIDIYNALPEDAAEMLAEYMSYYVEFPLTGQGEILVTYNLALGSFWTDGEYIVPKNFVVYGIKADAEGNVCIEAPQFDKEGNLISNGTVDIVWQNENKPSEELVQDMVLLNNGKSNLITGFAAINTDSDSDSTVLDQNRAKAAQQGGLWKDETYWDNISGYAQITVQGFFTTEYYGIWDDLVLHHTDDFSIFFTDDSNACTSFSLIAAGTLHPLRDSLPIIGLTALGGFLLLLIISMILCRQLVQIYDAQTELEAKRRSLTNAIAHDLKTPMAAVMGYAENLVEQTHPEKQPHYLKSLQAQTLRMDSILSRMLELSRLEADADTMAPETFSLAELCREAAQDCFCVDGRYTITGDAEITADREMLHRVLDNYLSNAKKHISPNGIVRVNISPGRCQVHNPGTPIPSNKLDMLWDAYYQADAARGSGNGLGLSIVREIISRHGFTCGAENEGDGVTFWFSWPI